MDDHLAKPYTRQQLAAMLERWLPANLVVEDSPGAAAETRERPTAKVISLDQSVLDNIRALDEDGTVLNEVIQMYLDEVPGHLAQMRHAVTAGDSAKLGSVAHGLKSASFNVGAPALGELCRRLERQGKSGDIAGAGEVVAEIESLIANLQPLLRAEMRLAA
jgi:HPt (histidine-containing phosphotransfer) domain-containing protein